MSRRHQGIVKRYEPARRFGFIIWNATVDDKTVLFFHIKEVHAGEDILDIHPGAKSNFRLRMMDKEDRKLLMFASSGRRLREQSRQVSTTRPGGLHRLPGHFRLTLIECSVPQCCSASCGHLHGFCPCVGKKLMQTHRQRTPAGRLCPLLRQSHQLDTCSLRLGSYPPAIPLSFLPDRVSMRF